MLKNISSFFAVITILFTVSSSAQQMGAEAGRLFKEGVSKMDAGDYNGAIASFDLALEIEQDYRIYHRKGLALRKANKIQDAIIAFNECLKIKPDYDLAINSLATAYFHLGDYSKAIEYFEKVDKLTKNVKLKENLKDALAKSYTQLGTSSLTDGNYDKAIEYLVKATSISNYDAAYLSLANAYNEIGNYDKAIEAAENAIKHKSKISTGGPYYYMGLAYRNKGDKAKALEAFNKAKADATYRKNAEYEISLLK